MPDERLEKILRLLRIGVVVPSAIQELTHNLGTQS